MKLPIPCKFCAVLICLATAYYKCVSCILLAVPILTLFCAFICRYKARMVTKEVEKVLPLLAHDRELGHKATRMF